MKNMLICSLFLCVFLSSSAFAANQNFIRVEEEAFKDGSNNFYFAGTNCYYLMEFGSETQGGYKNKAGVDEVLNDAKAMGLKVVRTWAFDDRFETAPNTHNEPWFRGLDYVLSKADQLGLRIILVFANNWAYGGIQRYVDWSPTASTHDEFYTDPNCKIYYKQHIDALVNRVNYYNGKLYKNDPTIFSWELCNEPRADRANTAALDNWIEEMSTYVKSIDPNHMVSTGIEGFYSNNNPLYPGWKSDGDTGTDFIVNHNHTNIDFAVTHFLPSDWSYSPANGSLWVTGHLNDARNFIHKPLVVEEYGIKKDVGGGVTERNLRYQEGANAAYYLNGGGFMFWTLYGDSYPDYDGYGVYYPADASTASVISGYAGQLNAKAAPFWNLLLPVKWTVCTTNYWSGGWAPYLILNYLDDNFPANYNYTTMYYYALPFNEPENRSGNLVDPTGVAAALNYYKLPQYNFSVITTDTLLDMLKYICHWMDYEVPNVAKPNSPVALPILTGYDHWVVVNGASTNVRPGANQHLWQLGEFTVYGLNLIDSTFADNPIGQHVYKTAAELSSYILPLNTGDKYNGKYAAVLEPPDYFIGSGLSDRQKKADVEHRLKKLKIRFAPRRVTDYAKKHVARKKVTAFSRSQLQGLIEPRVFANAEFSGLFYNSYPVKPLYVHDLSAAGRNYFIVPMAGMADRLTHVAVIVDASEGYFRELSWSAQGQPRVIMSEGSALDKIRDQRGKYRWWNTRTRLIYDPALKGSSLYCPVWEVLINGRERWIVNYSGKAVRLN